MGRRAETSLHVNEQRSVRKVRVARVFDGGDMRGSLCAASDPSTDRVYTHDGGVSGQPDDGRVPALTTTACGQLEARSEALTDRDGLFARGEIDPELVSAIAREYCTASGGDNAAKTCE
jgi:hypothetical protein